jgi:hypothetical protein
MMFASKTPRDLNRDPEPWRAPTSPEYRVSEEHRAYASIRLVHDPRPEYDHPQHNEPNPVLTRFRQDCARWGFNIRTEAYMWLHDDVLSDTGLWSSLGARDEHIAHARRVLTRLARMVGVS